MEMYRSDLGHLRTIGPDHRELEASYLYFEVSSFILCTYIDLNDFDALALNSQHPIQL